MWFLATRDRPFECIQLVAAFKATGDTRDAAVMIDDDPDKYRLVRWPKGWDIHVASEHLEMTRAMNTLLGMYPGKPCYGFFGDHFRPMTPMFDKLTKAVGDWFMSWPNDGEVSATQMAGLPTFGAKLIKEVGWLCLPTTIHVATEMPWHFLANSLGIFRHTTDAHFTRTWPVGAGVIKRKYGNIEDYNGVDGLAWKAWRDYDAPELIDRIRRLMKSDGYEFGDDGRLVGQGCKRTQSSWQENEVNFSI